MSFQPPVYIICRDRVDDLGRLVTWLEEHDVQRITLVDNASTYEPLLEYYEQTPHAVLGLEKNYGSRALWLTNNQPMKEHYVVTDPDVLPIHECPADAIDLLRRMLAAHPEYAKAGLGLYLDDIPQIQSLSWERSLVCQRRHIGDMSVEPYAISLYHSLIDTTFALYRPGLEVPHLLQAYQTAGDGRGLLAIRTGYPMQARHLPWYRLDHPTEEEQYYLDHMEDEMKGPKGSSWAEGTQ